MPHVTTHTVTALSRALRRQAARIAANLPSAAHGDREAIHAVRVASRRVRAALPIAGAVTRTDVTVLTRDTRRVTRALAGVREADVVQELIQAIPEGEGWTPDAVACVDAYGQHRRDRERRSARSILEDVDASELASRVNALAGALTESRRAPALAAALVSETRRRMRGLAVALEDAGVVYAVESLHRVRLAAKKLRYVIELGSRALPGVGGPAIRRLKQLQSRLGRLHDIQMAQHQVREAAGGPAATPQLAAELASLDRALEVQCRQAHARALRARAGLDDVFKGLERAQKTWLVPRELGRMARMRVVGGRRRASAR